MTRTGAKWEGIGFLLIVAAIVAGITSHGGLAIPLFAIGFVVFIVGRFK